MLHTPEIVRHVCKGLGSTEIHSFLAFVRHHRLSVHAKDGCGRRRRERSRLGISRTTLVNCRLMLWNCRKESGMMKETASKCAYHHSNLTDSVSVVFVVS